MLFMLSIISLTPATSILFGAASVLTIVTPGTAVPAVCIFIPKYFPFFTWIFTCTYSGYIDSPVTSLSSESTKVTLQFLSISVLALVIST